MRRRSALQHAGAPAPSTRDLILDAAERRFAERGFASVSMRALAAEVGLRNQASLYSHFRNKRALWEAVLARGIEPVVALVAASAEEGEGGTAGRGPEAFLDPVLDYLAARPHLPQLIQRAALDDSRYLRKSLPRLLAPLYQQGMRVLVATGGAWEPAELPHLAAGLYQLIFGYFTAARLFETVIGDDPLSPAALERQRRFVKAAVAGLLRRSGPSLVPGKRARGRTPRRIP